MKVTKKEWQEKLKNLHTREKGISSEHQIPYKELLKKVYIGKTVLDVGCGTCWLKDLLTGTILEGDVRYRGLDAYAFEMENPEVNHLIMAGDVIQGEIDNWNWEENDFTKIVETIFCFAALDGMRDLDKAFENMKRIASKNIVLLTGINIEPDQYHTHLITEDYLMNQMCPAVYTDGFGTPPKRIPGEWSLTYRQEIMKNKIIFLEFTRK